MYIIFTRCCANAFRFTFSSRTSDSWKLCFLRLWLEAELEENLSFAVYHNRFSVSISTAALTSGIYSYVSAWQTAATMMFIGIIIFTIFSRSVSQKGIYVYITHSNRSPNGPSKCYDTVFAEHTNSYSHICRVHWRIYVATFWYQCGQKDLGTTFHALSLCSCETHNDSRPSNTWSSGCEKRDCWHFFRWCLSKEYAGCGTPI